MGTRDRLLDYLKNALNESGEAMRQRTGINYPRKKKEKEYTHCEMRDEAEEKETVTRNVSMEREIYIYIARLKENKSNRYLRERR